MLPTAQQTPALAFSLLGRFELRLDGRELRSLPRKARALLAYLAMQEGKPVPREALADLLWTDRGVEQARHSLRQTLLVLRRELGAKAHAAMRSDERMLSLDPAAVSVDALQFRGMGGATDRAALEAAAALYRGPLMEGLPAVSRDFDAWLETTREAFADGAIDMLGRLADACAATRDWDQAIQSLERMLALDPLREDVHRRLIEMCGRAGRRSEALRHYKACVDLLRRELNVAPAPETEALVRRIQAENATDAVAWPTQLAPVPTDGPPWVAVLPFDVIGSDPAARYLGDGLVEDIVYGLATFREPVVISSRSTLHLAGTTIDIRRVSKELGARYVVSGSIRVLADQLRIRAELVQAESGIVIWTNLYDVARQDVLAVPDDITTRLVVTLVQRLQESELTRVRAKRPELMTAYDLVLQARSKLYELSRASFEQAAPLLQRAIDLDPGYASANTLYADWHSLRIGQGWSSKPGDDIAATTRHAMAAIAADPLDARALALHGHHRSFLHRDYEGARTLFARALDAAPNDASSWMWSSVTESYVGNAAEALRRAERALRLSPRDAFGYRLYAALCIAHYTGGEYEAAAEWGLKAAREMPGYTANLRFTSAALVAAGRVAEARELARQVKLIEPDFSVQEMIRRHPYRDPAARREIGARLAEAGLEH